MSFLDHIRRCNAHDPGAMRPFLIDGTAVGALGDEVSRALSDQPGIAMDADRVVLHVPSGNPDAVTEALDRLTDHLIARGLVARRRGETYAVVSRWGDDPLGHADRAVVPALGLRSFGVHVNGLVRKPNGLHVWVGRRSTDRAVAPGKLDNLVAGGQPSGLTLAENLRKEAAEEAGLDREWADRAVPVGALSYIMDVPEGRRVDRIFLYDLMLPEEIVPRNMDGEVESFELWPIDRVAMTVENSDAFKFNVNLVMIDLLIRHGWLKPERPDYLDIIDALHRG